MLANNQPQNNAYTTKKMKLGKELTAVDWFYDKIKSHFEHDGDLLETLNFTLAIAKEKERAQHGRTWDVAIKTHDLRGHVHSRSLVDFDDFEIR